MKRSTTSRKRSNRHAAWFFVLVFGALASIGLAGPEQPMAGCSEPYRIITVSAPEVCVLKEVLVREGERVKAKQILAKLETDTLQAELDIANAELRMHGIRKERIEQLAAEKRAAPEE